MNKNQNGFSIIDILLVIVVLGIIGVIGWYITQNRSKSPTSSNTTTNETSAKKLPAGKSVRDGDYITYTNTTLGLTFRYPVKLADLGTNADPETPALSLHEISAASAPRDAGLAYSFDGLQSKIIGGLVTKDWKSSSYKQGFTSYNACEPPEYKNTDKLIDTWYEVNDDVCVKALGVKNNAPPGDTYSSDYAIIMLEKKLNNKDYAGVQMVFFQSALKGFSQTGLVNTYDQELKTQITDIAKSMKEIK